MQRLGTLGICILVLIGCEKKQEAPPAAAVPNLRMSPDVRIALASGPVDTLDVTAIEPGPNGSIYALQPVQRRIAVYDHQGKLLKTFGQDHLRAPSTLGWHKRMIWVWDPSLRELIYFKPDGTLNDRATLALPARSNVEAVLTDSTLLVNAVLSADTSRGDVRRALLNVNLKGVVLDTIAIVSDHHALLTARPNSSSLSTVQPFAERTYSALAYADGMIVLAHADTAEGKPVLRVTKLNHVGDTVFSKLIPYKPKRFDAVLVAPTVGRLIEANHHSWQGDTPPDDEQTRLLRRALYTPRYLPTITGLVLAIDGTILVRREESTNQVEWTVLNRVGQVVATQKGPAKAHLLLAIGPFMFAAEHEPGAIPEVVRYRLFGN